MTASEFVVQSARKGDREDANGFAATRQGLRAHTEHPLEREQFAPPDRPAAPADFLQERVTGHEECGSELVCGLFRCSWRRVQYHVAQLVSHREALPVSRLLSVHDDHVRRLIPSVSLPGACGHAVDCVEAHGHHLDASVLKKPSQIGNRRDPESPVRTDVSARMLRAR